MDELLNQILRVSVAQIAREVGFSSIHEPALDTLTDVVKKYLLEIGTLASTNAQQARRTDVNFLDIVNALKELGVDLDELVQFAKNSEPVPFAFDLPEFPQPRGVVFCSPSRTVAPDLSNGVEMDTKDESSQERKEESANSAMENPDAMQDGEEAEQSKISKRKSPSDNSPEDIPEFLPDLPDPHTYKFTPVYDDHEMDASTRRKLVIKQKRQIESSLVKLNRVMQKGRAVSTSSHPFASDEPTKEAS